MSTVVYGALSRKRADAQRGQSVEGQPPGLQTYVDSFAALVPAEALVMLQPIILAISETTTADDGLTSTRVTDVEAGQLAFWGLVGVTILMYVAGRARTLSLPTTLGSELLRATIPAAAMAGWIMLQEPELFGTVFGSVSEAKRGVIGVLGLVVLGIAASALGKRADGQPSQLQSDRTDEEDEIDGGDGAQGDGVEEVGPAVTDGIAEEVVDQ